MAPDRAALLAAYDAQLRTDAETRSARSLARRGPLHIATLDSGRGFVTYRDLLADGAPPTEDALRALVADVVEHFEADRAVTEVEWKTRGHDVAPGLHDALVAAGFVPGEPESIVIGEAHLLAVDVPLPDGVALRRVTEPADVRAMVAMQEEVFAALFGAAVTEEGIERRTAAMMRALARGSGTEYWVAEAHGSVVCAGRLEPVPGTQFAGIWGGATRPEWRGRGIYRALTAARARAALALGVRYLHSDSTEYSRPILERAGMVTVSTTTPYTRAFPR